MASAEDSAAAAWFERIAAAYPPQTTAFLLRERDPFRNPAGHAFREALPVLIDELAGDMNPDRLAPALESIMRIRAVQFCVEDEAIAFVALARGFPPERLALLAALARAEFRRCQRRMKEIGAREAERRVYLLRRMQGRLQEGATP